MSLSSHAQSSVLVAPRREGTGAVTAWGRAPSWWLVWTALPCLTFEQLDLVQDQVMRRDQPLGYGRTGWPLLGAVSQLWRRTTHKRWRGQWQPLHREPLQLAEIVWCCLRQEMARQAFQHLAFSYALHDLQTPEAAAGEYLQPSLRATVLASAMRHTNRRGKRRPDGREQPWGSAPSGGSVLEMDARLRVDRPVWRAMVQRRGALSMGEYLVHLMHHEPHRCGLAQVQRVHMRLVRQFCAGVQIEPLPPAPGAR